MASSEEFVRFVADQISDAGIIRFRKMFGEYGIYVNGIYCATVCDNRFFVKITGAGTALCPDCATEYPYEGSKRKCFLVTDLENRDRLAMLLQATAADLARGKSP